MLRSTRAFWGGDALVLSKEEIDLDCKEHTIDKNEAEMAKGPFDMQPVFRPQLMAHL